ncbi:MAG TPA: histidine kinase N-terminal 7TM domain-containing protein, partial [Myxococcota bacterium]|nr:histidine kinase N-terminal 7TM domain-containing protein [Myxococcota bacterium]
MISVWPIWLVLALCTTAGLSVLGAYIWRSRATEGGASFLVLIAGVGLWVLCSGFEHAAVDLDVKLRLAKLAWLGIGVVPLSALVVALQATGREHLVRPSLVGLLALPSAAMVALVLTNEHHHWVWSSVALEAPGERPDLHLPHGPAFWVSAAWNYTLLVTAGALLARRYVREWPRNREEAVLVTLAMAAPWVANAHYLATESQRPSIDFTPYAFSVTAVCLSLALWRGHGLLNVIRVARSQILDEM